MNTLIGMFVFIFLGAASTAASLLNYFNDDLGKACFFAIISAALFIVREIQRRPSVIYHNCTWNIPTENTKDNDAETRD